MPTTNPDIKLLRDTEKMIVNLRSLDNDFMLKLKKIKPEIEAFKTRTTTGDEGVRSFAKWRTDMIVRDEIDTYKQEYRNNALKIRGDLMAECPGIANIRLNYAEPANVLEFSEMADDLEALSREYKNKLLAEGKRITPL
jgi:hypothetical protein